MSSGLPTELTEDQIDATIQKIKNAEPARKVDIIQFFGLQLENLTSPLPPSTLPALTLLLPPLLRSSHPLLPHTILYSLLPFLLPLLPPSPPAHALLAVGQLAPAVWEKVGEGREKIHSEAEKCLVLLGILAYTSSAHTSPNPSVSSASASTTNTLHRSTSSHPSSPTSSAQLFDTHHLPHFSSKSPRLKLGALKVLLGLFDGHKGLPLKQYLPLLVEVLLDGDGAVRESAKETIIHLLSPTSTPPAARSELRKLFTARGVKPSVADGIFARISEGGVEKPKPKAVGEPTPGSALGGSGGGEAIVIGEDSEVPVVFIATPSDIHRDFLLLKPAFVGKETEENWLQRDAGVKRVRGMIRAIAGIQRGEGRRVLEGALLEELKGGFLGEAPKALQSLRTTLATNAISLYIELAETLGKHLDPVFEAFVTPLGRMAGMTKKLVAARAQSAVTSAITHTSCPIRVFMPFLYEGLRDKIPQTRTFFAGHLKTFLDVHGKENVGAVALKGLASGEATLVGALKKALGDSNPQAKELARQAYWSFAVIWPEEAKVLLGEMDTVAKRGIEKARPGLDAVLDPNGQAAAEKGQVSVPAPAAATGKRTTMSAMEAIRKARMQQRGRVVSSGGASDVGQEKLVGGEDEAVVRRTSLQPRSRTSVPKEEEQEKVVGVQGMPQVDSGAVGLGVGPEGLPLSSPTRPAPAIERLGSNGEAGPSQLSVPRVPDIVDLSSPKPSPRASPQKETPPATSSLNTPTKASSPPPSPIHRFPTPELPTSLPRTNGRKASAPPLQRIPIPGGSPQRSNRSQSLPDSPPPDFLIDSLANVDCSFWLDRQPIEPRPASPEEQTHLLSLLRSNILTLSDLESLSSFLASLTPDPNTATSEQGILGLIRKSKEAYAAEDVEDDRGGVEGILLDLLGWIGPLRHIELLEQSVLILWQISIYFNTIASQHEGDILSLLLNLRRCSDSEIRRGSASLAALLASSTPDPVSQLNSIVSMHHHLEQTLTPTLDSGASAGGNGKAQERNNVFVLVQIARLLLRLPGVVAEEEARRLREMIMSGINSPSISTREATTTLLLSLQSRLHDESLLFSLLPELSTAQKNLLVYMFARKGLEGSRSPREGEPEGDEGGVGFGREMRRLSSKM